MIEKSIQGLRVSLRLAKSDEEKNAIQRQIAGLEVVQKSIGTGSNKNNHIIQMAYTNAISQFPNRFGAFKNALKLHIVPEFDGGGVDLKELSFQEYTGKWLFEQDFSSLPTEKINSFISEPNINPLEKNKVHDDAQLIIEQPDIDIKRKMLIDWILNSNVVILIAFSGGKDSVAIVLYLLDLGVPKERIELWHHDINGFGEELFDWACTPSYCTAFAKAFDLKILFSYREGGIVREIFKSDDISGDIYFQEVEGGEYRMSKTGGEPSTRLMFPAVSPDLSSRWCSPMVKIDVMSRGVNNIERLKNCNLLVCTGERRAESSTRSKYNEIEPYRSMSRTRRAITWRPIINLSDAEVWKLMEKYKVQPHPAYELGWSRCSCQLCIFSSPNTWAAINEISPEKVSRIAAIENTIDHTLYNKMTILEKVAKGNSFLNKSVLDKWKAQALGEFTAPIFVETWVLPLGAKNSEQTGAN